MGERGPCFLNKISMGFTILDLFHFRLQVFEIRSGGDRWALCHTLLPLSHPLSQSHSSDQNRFRSVAIPNQLPTYMNVNAFSQSKNWFERANVL
jgi:hypothetical protein